MNEYDSLTNPVFKTPVKKVKIGRNDPCPCGSGKKYKKWCLNKKDYWDNKASSPLVNLKNNLKN